MKRFEAAASLFLGVSVVALAGCGDFPWQADAFKPNAFVNGSTAGGSLNYASLMRVGAAAEAGGDFATAVGVYRKAAAVDTNAVAPFVATGNARCSQWASSTRRSLRTNRRWRATSTIARPCAVWPAPI